MMPTGRNHQLPPDLQIAGLARVPTQAQITEVENLRAIQVRTNAVQMAVAAQGGQQIETLDLIRAAAVIADFISPGVVEVTAD